MRVAMKAAMASMVLLAVSASGVQAAAGGGGQITFEGEILEAACSIKPESLDQTVSLGQVAKSQLTSGGITASKFFQIELTGCTTTTTATNTVSATFTGGASTDVTGALGLTGTAAGAGIKLVDGSGSTVTLGTKTKVQTLMVGDNTLLFGAYVQGKATGDITPGTFQSVTNFSLDYL